MTLWKLDKDKVGKVGVHMYHLSIADASKLQRQLQDVMSRYP
jgi:hypothetical protein